MDLGAGQAQKRRKRKSPKIRNLRPYYNKEGLGLGPWSRPSPKEKERERKGKAQKSEIWGPIIIRKGWALDLGAGQAQKRRKRKSPKIRNLRPYYNKEGLGPWSLEPAKPKREGKGKAQKSEIWGPIIIRKGWGLGAGQAQKRRKRKSPKIRNLRPYYNKEGLGLGPWSRPSPKEKEKEKPKNQKFEALLK